MTNKIIAQSSRFRAVRTSRDRVRIKSASSHIEYGSFIRKGAEAPWMPMIAPQTESFQDILTFAEAVYRTLQKEAK